MTDKTDRISILEVLKKGSFKASLIATYNSYFPFYENVILKSLINNGCRHNVLLMDYFQYHECISTPSLRPQTAGFKYSLIPINANDRAFHPKIILLIGEKKGILFVGSHNMTLSGICLNNELTTKINITLGKKEHGVDIAKEVLLFLEQWILSQSDKIPPELFDAFNKLKNFAPWLVKKTDNKNKEIQFIGSPVDDRSLWNIVKQKINEPVKDVLVLGPFFDKKLLFLKKIIENLKPQKIIVGIDPNDVLISPQKDLNDKINFVDASPILDESRYLHAKIIYIELESGKKLLITGSANPSRPAWIESPKQRNSEAIILHDSSKVSEIVGKINLLKLHEYPEISQEKWKEIEVRVNAQKEQFATAIRVADSIIAIAEKSHIKFKLPIEKIERIKNISCLNENEVEISIIKKQNLNYLENQVVITISIEFISSIRFIKISFDDSDDILGIVHHPEEINRTSNSSKQVQFRKLLNSLHSDTPDLENLIMIVERIIFDEPIEINSQLMRGKKSKKNDPDSQDVIMDSLSTNEILLSKKHHRNKMITSGDLGYLLDVLIYHLGIDLENRVNQIDSKGRSEEDLVNSDDNDDADETHVEIKIPELIKICNRKTKKLIDRMIRNFEKTAQDKEFYSNCLVKLLGVIAVLREMRSLDLKYVNKIPYNEKNKCFESFFPLEEKTILFNKTMLFLFDKKYNFYTKSQKELVEIKIDELLRLNGMLIWLGNEVGVDLNIKNLFNESYRARKVRVENNNRFLKLMLYSNKYKLQINKNAKESFRKTSFNLHYDNKCKWLNTQLINTAQYIRRLKQRRTSSA